MSAGPSTRELTAEIFDKLPAGLVYVTAGGAIEIANPAACKFLGLTYDTMRKRYVSDWDGETLRADGSVCPVEDYPVSRCLATGEEQPAQIIGVRRPDDTVTWALFSASPHRSGGELAGAIVLFRDITAQLLAEERLRVSEARHHQLIQNIPHGVQECDRDGTITLSNPAHARMHGYDDPAEMIGKKVWDFAVDDAKKREIREYMALLVREQPEPTPFISQDRTAGGDIIDVQVDWTYQRDRAGELTGFVSVITDITDRLVAEREVAMQRASRIESIGVLAGGIAHDFNNLLTSVMLSVSMAATQVESDSRAAELLREATEAASRATRLTRQLLTFAKGGTPIKAPVDVSGLLDIAHLALPGSTVACEVSRDGELSPIWADASQIEQVIQNLVINATQATPDGGTIRLTARNVAVDDASGLPLEPGAYVHLSVADSGVGIEPAKLGRIFEPYFTTKESGSGLGLAVAHSIVNSHNGHIEVSSELGVGTTVDIYLPVSSRPVAKSRAPNPSTPPAIEARLLVMDDDPQICVALTRLLCDYGYEVDTVGDGRAAVDRYLAELASDRPYTAVIFDLTVRGGMGGRKAIEELLRHDPGVRAAVMSGYSDDPVLADPERYGFAGVLGKPFTPQAVIQMLGTVLVA